MNSEVNNSNQDLHGGLNERTSFMVVKKFVVNKCLGGLLSTESLDHKIVMGVAVVISENFGQQQFRLTFEGKKKCYSTRTFPVGLDFKTKTFS